jgi:hypothetical protein
VAPAGRLSHRAADFRQNVRLGRVVNVLRRIQAQAVEMELLDPVRGVGRDKFAYARRAGTVEVDDPAPIVVLVLDERIREFVQVIAISGSRPECRTAGSARTG